MIPAQVTRMSRPPCSSTVRATADSTASRLVTLVSSFKPGASSSNARSASATFAPSDAKRTAVAFPIPRPPPVTSATFPSKRVTLVAYALVHEKRIEIRWRDLDAYQHVNQAVYLTYLEEVLDHWLRGVLGLADGQAWHYVAADVSIDYRAELRLSDRYALGSVRLERVGTKSVTTRAELRAPDGRVAAEAELVIVSRDTETGESQPLTDQERTHSGGRLRYVAVALIALGLAGSSPAATPGLTSRHPCAEAAGFTCSTLTVPVDAAGA